MKRLVFLLTLLILAQTVIALDVPKPTGFVNDHAGMLTPEERVQLEAHLQKIAESSTAEIAIYTIPSLADENLEMYATRVFREWGVGKADVNNGVLILVAKEERKVRIETGTGVEGAITDVRAGLIIRNRIAPAFQQGKVYEGLSLAATDMHKLIAEDPSTLSAYEQRAASTSGEWFAVIGLIVLYSLTAAIIAIAYRNNKKKKDKAIKITSGVVFVLAWVLSAFITSAILWFVIFFILMINITATGGAGFFFLPGGRMGGGGFGGGGFGGFGGGFSGGGGSSGGW